MIKAQNQQSLSKMENGNKNPIPKNQKHNVQKGIN